MKMKEKNNSIWKNWYAIVAYCIFGFIILSFFTSNDVSNCDKEEQEIEDLKIQIKNLEEGLVTNCEWGKAGTEAAISSIELLESLGYYSLSEYKYTFEEQSKVNCYDVLNLYKNKE
jgi:hypothetical protein